MQNNAATLHRFYAAFAQLDSQTMGACYAPDASFDDPAFSLRGQTEVAGMWNMLCEATKAKGMDVWKLESSGISATGLRGKAHWEAHYRFSATGRLVHNIIDGEFEFNEQGLILRHRDHFDFWRWARQALGAPGLLLGWTPLLRNKVRTQAAANLRAYLAKKRRVAMGWFAGFDSQSFEVNGASIFARFSRRVVGEVQKPALLLLHGFPQSHVLWHRVARQLAPHYFLVMPDLRGYGNSSKTPGLPDHSNYSKRNLAHDVAAVMDALGVRTFGVCGHDRGGRVAHRLALDLPERVDKLCVIDIAPTLDMYEGNTLSAHYMEFARAYYHWFHMLQPSPLPEIMMGSTHPELARAYLHAKLGGWGSQGLGYIEPEALAEYERTFCTAEAIHTACEDYRASAGIDLEHDRESRARGDKVTCELLVLWGERGVVHRLFDPMALWQQQCSRAVTGQALPAGHFIPEELPAQTADALHAFFGTGA